MAKVEKVNIALTFLFKIVNASNINNQPISDANCSEITKLPILITFVYFVCCDAECQKILILSVVIQNVLMLSVMAPNWKVSKTKITLFEMEAISNKVNSRPQRKAPHQSA
jgi:hypothetical protein